MQLEQDLQWLLNTAPMYQGDGFIDDQFLLQFKQPLIDKIRSHASASCPAISVTAFRLGHYYEALWIRLLQLHPDYQLLLQNWPIYHRKRTLGALDLVVEHRPSQTLEHWELALKFYLLKEHQLATNLSKWVGPNKQDTLAKKSLKCTTTNCP